MQSEFTVGVAVTVGCGDIPVMRVLAPNASAMTGPGTNTYLLGRERLAIVDPGPADPVHTGNLLRALQGRPVEGIFVTHTHSDHSPGTAVLLQHLEAPVIGLPAPPGSGQDPGFRPSRHYTDGDIVHLSEFSMRLLHTPGHVSNHLCFLLEADGMLFCGDHILEGMTPVILPPDGSMKAYLDSLVRLASEPIRLLAPAHGRVMDEPQQVIQRLIRHRLQRERRLLSVLAAQGGDILALPLLTERVYEEVPKHLLPWAQRTLLAHLIKLEQEGRAHQLGEGWQLAVPQ
ncbi:MAG: MBL fold metallo-hydrolase [Pseudomonadales bacterium]|nr:MBL fold metallo-hydrolase [Pseudomonadales bacterium]MCP5330868.1 MBL fold metallo-hydrolase [Pseudomonadales bacterium]MCP5343248.1 MBL fold metallo-hydrolase [Pseudomonadales bacterium]